MGTSWSSQCACASPTEAWGIIVDLALKLTLSICLVTGTVITFLVAWKYRRRPQHPWWWAMPIDADTIIIRRDGDEYIAHLGDFDNIQASTSGYGKTPDAALAALQTKFTISTFDDLKNKLHPPQENTP
jgi:hypothetical protein